jgi:hypothetical protein
MGRFPMSEIDTDLTQVPKGSEGRSGNAVAIVAIIAAAVVAIACMAACTGIAIAFLINAPW